jgi:hypothetical protein
MTRRRHKHVNGDLCDGTPSDCPVAALRKARATALCGNYYDPGCYFYDHPELSNGSVGAEQGRSSRDLHGDLSSALLDGFTADQINLAEITLARESRR